MVVRPKIVLGFWTSNSSCFKKRGTAKSKLPVSVRKVRDCTYRYTYSLMIAITSWVLIILPIPELDPYG
jgi:hypothetical protein